MTKNDPVKSSFNKPLYCAYQSTSDDLMFWCWFDVLILGVNFDFDPVQISALFSVSFWIALVMKIPGAALAKRLGAGRSILLSAFMFLAAALLLTFGRTFAAAVIGQSIYLAAIGFQEMSSVILKNAAGRDPVHVDYLHIMATTGGIYAMISLAAAAFMSRLFAIDQNLPMYICIGFCLSSCVMAYFVGRYDIEDAEKDVSIRRDVLPGVKMRSFDKTTLSCLFLSVLFMAFFTVSGGFFKIMIEDDLSALTSESGTVFQFSMVLLASRIVKILSNLILYISRKRKLKSGRSLTVIVLAVLLVPVLGCLSRCGTGYPALILIAAAFLIRVLLHDPFRFTVFDFMLRRLKEDRMTEVLFAHSVGVDLFTALISTISTLLLKHLGMFSVMLMLLIVCIMLASGYFFIHRNLVRVNGNRAFMKWKKEEIGSSDQLMVASVILFMHYGAIKDASYTPQKLAEKISSVEDISTAWPAIQFGGYHDYSEETLKTMYDSGHPCAIRAVVREGEPDRWLPVLYLDDDGGVVWNPDSEERFIAQFYQIHEICCFSI